MNPRERRHRYREWVPAPQRLRASVHRGAQHLGRNEFFAAYRAFGYALDDAEGSELEFVHGLRHLAAAGYKRQRGDKRGADRQLEHAKRRLTPFRPRHLDIEVDKCLEALPGPPGQ